jgi:hypothetical protein
LGDVSGVDAPAFKKYENVRFELDPAVTVGTVKLIVFGLQIGTGLLVTTNGCGLTTKFTVVKQPFALVKVIIDVPEEIPVTKPVLLIVAIPGLEDCQAFDEAGIFPDN